MLKLKNTNKTLEKLTKAQRFYVERMLELLDDKTVDTNRARLHNPKTIILELHQILIDWDQGKVTHFESVKKIIKETIELLVSEKELQFQQVKKDYFQQLLKTAEEKKYKKLLYSTKLILAESKEYLSLLFKRIIDEIGACNKNADLQVHDLLELNRLIGLQSTELLNLNYSKSFVRRFFWELFIRNKKGLEFDNLYNSFRSLTWREEQSYSAIFKIIIRKEHTREQLQIVESSHVVSDESRIATIVEKTNHQGMEFHAEVPKFSKHVLIKVRSKDYYLAVNGAKEKLASIIDSIFLGYNQPEIELHKDVLLFKEDEPQKANTNPLNYKIFGSYYSNQRLYETIQSKLNNVFDNPQISQEAQKKIKSAVRYLRLGNEAQELEQTFLNYWIGLEFIFSSNAKDEKPFPRLIANFPICHSSIYVKRNLRVFHKDLVRLELEKKFSFIDNNYTFYLNDETNYDAIKSKCFSQHPIVAFRTYCLKRTLFHTERRTKYINRHRSNLEWNLARIYRIRNEIVHDAAIKPSITRITIHARYYLTFILFALLEFFDDPPIDSGPDHLLSVNDFFMYQKVLFESLEKNKFPLEDLLMLKDPVESFSN